VGRPLRRRLGPCGDLLHGGVDVLREGAQGGDVLRRLPHARADLLDARVGLLRRGGEGLRRPQGLLLRLPHLQEGLPDSGAEREVGPGHVADLVPAPDGVPLLQVQRLGGPLREVDEAPDGDHDRGGDEGPEERQQQHAPPEQGVGDPPLPGRLPIVRLVQPPRDRLRVVRQDLQGRQEGARALPGLAHGGAHLLRGRAPAAQGDRLPDGLRPGPPGRLGPLEFRPARLVAERAPTGLGELPDPVHILPDGGDLVGPHDALRGAPQAQDGDLLDGLEEAGGRREAPDPGGVDRPGSLGQPLQGAGEQEGRPGEPQDGQDQQ